MGNKQPKPKTTPKFKSVVNRVITEMKSKPKVPIQLRKEIYSYLGECDDITNNGKRCSKAFHYTDKKGGKVDCVNYCLKQCDKWIKDVIDDLPASLTIDDVKLEITRIAFIDDNTRQNYAYYYEYYTASQEKWIKNGMYETDSKEVKRQICMFVNQGGNLIVEVDTIISQPSRKFKAKMLALPTGTELDNVSLLNNQGNRWFTPKWQLSNVHPIDDTLLINIQKKYKFT